MLEKFEKKCLAETNKNGTREFKQNKIRKSVKPGRNSMMNWKKTSLMLLISSIQ